MVRKGDYTNYNGEEYRVITDRKGKTYLISNNNEDLKKVFINIQVECSKRKLTGRN